MKLLILGAGGHGQVCKEIAQFLGIYETIDFIDDEKNRGNVVGSFNDFYSNIDKYKKRYDNVFLGLGYDKVRLELIKMCDNHGFKFCNLISPNAFVSKSCKLGRGIFISHGVLINANTKIGDNAILGIGCIIDHNSEVKANSYIHAGNIVQANSCYPIKTLDNTKVNSNVCTFDE